MKVLSAYPLITTLNLRATRDFYIDHFGLEVIFEASWIVMLGRRSNGEIALGFMTDHRQQIDEAVQLIHIVPSGEAYHLCRSPPVVFGAGLVQKRRGYLDDELLAIIRVGQIHRIIGIDEQQLARSETVLLLLATPKAITLEQNLQVEYGLECR